MFDLNRIKMLSNPLNVIIVSVIVLFICIRVFSNNHENDFVIESIKQAGEKNEQTNEQQTELQTSSQSGIQSQTTIAEMQVDETPAVETSQTQNTSNTTIGTLAYSEELGKTFTLDAFNELSKNDLMTFSGVGEVTAQAILDYRRENGPFKQFDDLMLVKGIGEKKLQKIMTLP